MMNKSLAIVGSIAGALSAVLLMTGLSSTDSAAHFYTERCEHAAGPVESRVLQWRGDDGIDIRVPASVHFTTGPEWRATATGPSEVLKHLRFQGGELEFETSYEYCGEDLKIELSGPEVRHWSLRGRGDLTLVDLNQDKLDLYVAGSGSVRASGKVRETSANIKGSGDLALEQLLQQRIELDIHGSGSASARGEAEHARIAIYGSGTARFGKLKVKTADIRIHGSGNIFIAPSEYIDAQMYGSGNVQLLSAPRQIYREIHGSGRINEAREIAANY